MQMFLTRKASASTEDVEVWRRSPGGEGRTLSLTVGEDDRQSVRQILRMSA